MFGPGFLSGAFLPAQRPARAAQDHARMFAVAPGRDGPSVLLIYAMAQ